MKTLLAIIAISSVAAMSCGKKESAAETPKVDSALMMNKEAARAIIADFGTDKANASLDKYVMANYTEHTPEPNQKAGLAGLKEVSANFHTAFPDMKITVTDVVAEGDMVAVHSVMRGTNTGSMMGMPPTGKKVEVGGVDLMKFASGKGTDHWGYYEQEKMMQQLGLMPAPGAPAAEGKMAPEMKKGK